MAGRFSVEAVFKAVDRVTRPVSRMQTRIQRFTRTAANGFRRLNRNVTRFNQNMRAGATRAVASMGLVALALKNVLGAGVDFEQTLVNAAAKFPGEIRKGTEAFKELEQAARRTGATTEFTASQSAEALNFLAMAGFNAEASIVALPGVVDLATAAQVDLATATDIATDSLGAFNMMSKDTAQLGRNLARINDVIAKTTTTANTTVTDLFEAFKEGGPVATTAGASIETFSALAGELANAGIKGSRAGTTLKNMFLKLASPSAEGARLMKHFGVQTQTADGDMRDIVDIIGDLNSALSDLGSAQRTGVLEGIFGRIPIAGVNVLLASGSERLREYRKSLEGASGASGEMAAMMRDTTRGSINALISAIEGVKISIFSMNDGPLKGTIDRMTDWVRANEGLIAQNVGKFINDLITNLDEIVRVGKQIGQVVALYMLLVVAIKIATAVSIIFNTASLTIAATMKIVTGAIWLYRAAAAALPAVLAAVRTAMLLLNLVFAANPIGFVITAITTLIALAAAVITSWDPVKEFFADLWESISSVIEGAGKALDTAKDFLGFGDDDEGGSAKAPEPKGGFFDFLGFGDDDEGGRFDQNNVAQTVPNVTNVVPNVVVTGTDAANVEVDPQVISPQDRVARSIDERRNADSAEIVIRPDFGVQAEVVDGQLPNEVHLMRSGEF